MLDDVKIDQSALTTSLASPGIQAAMSRARSTLGHALCLCNGSPSKLQIRLRDNKLHLAVWPNEGLLHHRECLFFRDEINEEARSHALTQKTPSDPNERPAYDSHDARHDLKIHHFFHLGNARADAPSSYEPISLRRLIDMLWIDGSLTRWHPDWTRDWMRTRYELTKAASRYSISGIPLEKMLFIPGANNLHTSPNSPNPWDEFVHTVLQGDGHTPGTGLLVAPIRQVSIKDRQRMSFLPRLMTEEIHLTDRCSDYIERTCSGSLHHLWLQNKGCRDYDGQISIKAMHNLPAVIGIFHVELGRQGVFSRAAHLLSVHPGNFIPASSVFSVRLIDALCDGGYTFERIKGFGKDAALRTPSWLVRNVFDPTGKIVPRAALDVVHHHSEPQYIQERKNLAAALADKGVPTWSWHPVGNPSFGPFPHLPPHARSSDLDAKTKMALIRLTPEVVYSYGNTTKGSN